MSNKATQFKPGESGNPDGRPKKGNSWKDVLDEAMGQTHKVGGEEKTLKQIISDVLSKKALKGDLKAIEMIMNRLDGKPNITSIVEMNVGNKSALSKYFEDKTKKDD